MRFMPAPQIVLDLVERFRLHRESYQAAHYKEAQLRQEFIDPLLKAAADSPRGVADMVNISSVAGRRANRGSGVYNLTKHGVGAFSESLRQEFASRRVRVSLVEPGAVITELTDHMREEQRARSRERLSTIERLTADDIADTIEYIVTRPARVAINEILVRPTDQEW